MSTSTTGRDTHQSKLASTQASAEVKASGAHAVWWEGSLMKIHGGDSTGGALGLVEAKFYEGFGPPLHRHRREDEGFYILEGRIRFVRGEEDFVSGPGSLIWMPRGVVHAFKVEPGGARALLLLAPAGCEQMFAEGGVPLSESPEPPTQEYDPQTVIELSDRYGLEVVGPQLT
jgi:quercetin dioxygenase-like cupin family protein